MKLHELSPSEGSKKKAFRVGRGHGSGNGKTSGKGQKVKKLVAAAVFVPALKADRCLSTEDFQNVALQIFFAKKYTSINVEDLNKFDNGTEITAEVLKENGVIKKKD